MEMLSAIVFSIVFLWKAISWWEKVEQEEEMVNENKRLREQLHRQQVKNDVLDKPVKNCQFPGTKEVIIT
ncbi:MAG: hypothetical protein AAF518_24210, partial [Spirochaetota bacterium]